jgi:hypothetical protein
MILDANVGRVDNIYLSIHPSSIEWIAINIMSIKLDGSPYFNNLKEKKRRYYQGGRYPLGYWNFRSAIEKQRQCTLILRSNLPAKTEVSLVFFFSFSAVVNFFFYIM